MDFSRTYHADDNQTFQNSAVNPTQSSKHIFLQCVIGANEFFSPEMWRATVTEFVATACLLFTLISMIVACLESQYAEPKLLIPIAVFVIAFLMLMVTVPLSGGHMNPIFSFIAALKGAITIVRALFYILAQCLGSIVAYGILKGVMKQNVVEKYALVGCFINRNGEGISTGSALIIEFSCTFLVLYVAITVAFDKGKFKEFGLPMVCVIMAGVVAVAFFVSITVTEQPGYGGVGLNPVRCLGPAVLLGGTLWDGHWVFWLGPFAACIFYYAFTLTLPKKKHL